MPKNQKRSTSEEAKDKNVTLTQVELASKFVKNKTFVACCLEAHVPPTKRQASKFRNGRGRAFAQLATLRKSATLEPSE